MQRVNTCASLNVRAVASGRASEPFGRCRPHARMLATRLAATVAVALALPGAASAMVDGAAPLLAAPAARPAAAPLPAPLRPVFVVTGHGWGHGIGMGQYGAYGYAQHGWDYKRILAHYYPGTVLGDAPVAKVRVLLASGSHALTVGATGPLRVAAANGKAYRLPAGTYPLTAALKMKVPGAEKAKALPGPLVLTPLAGPFELDGVPYRGSVQVAVVGGALQAVNTLSIDSYVQGVVPREMPSGWAPEALKAQAVVARSYALSHLHGGAFDVYKDTRSQVYGGLGAERPSTNAAVLATAGQVGLYDGVIAQTFFFSTSGGRTAAIQDAWPKAEPVPYLVSVPDPYDTLSPYHNWGPTAMTPSALARKLHVPGGSALDAQVQANGSARVQTLTVIGSRGKVALTGQDARAALGLRSSWFRVGVLGAFAKPKGTLTYGAKAQLTAVARGLTGVAVQTRAPGGLWKTLAQVQPGTDGSVQLPVTATATTQYRLIAGSTQGAATSVLVAPLVRFRPVTDATHLQGYEKPALPGTSVQIQRLVGKTWTTVTTASVDGAGTFEATLQLQPGSYRARFAPGHGLVAGTTPVLEVVGA
jgi:stage II sporulation protein D